MATSAKRIVTSFRSPSMELRVVRILSALKKDNIDDDKKEITYDNKIIVHTPQGDQAKNVNNGD